MVAMNTTQVKCFLSVAKTLNFTKSAEELYLSQSTVSKNIKNLEKEIQVKLVNRNYHHVYLTEKGKIFYNRMSLIAAEIDSTVANLQQGQVIDRPKIKMGYTDLPFEKKWLPIALKLTNTKTHIDLVPYFVNPGREHRITQLITNGTVDLMLIQRDIMKKADGTKYFELFKKGFSVIVYENDPLFLKQQITFDDLVGHNIYLWNGNDDFPAIESLKYSLNTHVPSISFSEEDDTSTIIAYIRAGMGIGIVPSVLYNKDDTDLRYISLVAKQVLSYGIVYAQDSEQPELISEVNKLVARAVNVAKVNFWFEKKSNDFLSWWI